MAAYQVVPTELKKYKFSENAFLPKVVTVQLKQDKKCNYLCLVKAGDFVQEGDVIAIPDREAESFAKIHSPIPGKVIDIVTTLTPSGHYEKAVKIKLEGKFSFTGKKLRKADLSNIPAKDLLTKIADKGIINTFLISKPESLSWQINNLENRKDRALIVRLYDEDKLRLSDSLLTKFYAAKIIEGAKLTAKMIGTKNIVLVADAKTNVDEISALIEEQKIYLLKNRINHYPAGYKREIISSFNKSLKKTCDFTISAKDLFTDSYTMLNVENALVYDVPSISTYVQLTGNCLSASCFLKVKIGFTLKELVTQLGGFVHEPSMIIINGAVCGSSVNSLDVPITKNVKSVEFISKKNIFDYQIYNCIHCGNCRFACQVKISPDIIYAYMNDRKAVPEAFIKSVALCTECGLCNSVCPSRLPLTQTISILKVKLSGENNEK